MFDKQDIRKTFIKQKKITELLLNELMLQILGKHIFLGVVPGADQKQNLTSISNFIPSTQVSAEDTAVNKSCVGSVLIELEAQGTSRKENAKQIIII